MANSTIGRRVATRFRGKRIRRPFCGGKLSKIAESRGAHARVAFIAPLIATIFTANYIRAHSIRCSLSLLLSLSSLPVLPSTSFFRFSSTSVALTLELFYTSLRGVRGHRAALYTHGRGVS